MNIRTAMAGDIARVESIYEEIHAGEAAGEIVTGWIRGVYPTRKTAEAALERGDLYVMEDADRIVGAAVINQMQVDVYRDARWSHPAEDREVLVLHTLVISPTSARRGYGRRFVEYYEALAAQRGLCELRMDTNARNLAARALYKKLGYREVGIVPTVFNGIPDVMLVLLEKTLKLPRLS